MDDGEKPLAGYQLLAPTSSVAVKSKWMLDILVSLNCSKSRRKAEPELSEIVKRLIDGFFEPWDLAKDGETSTFHDDKIFHVLKCKLLIFDRYYMFCVFVVFVG